ncbi:MAG: hypothetical protein EA423_13085 [Phycisphaerales bacterium]|nr:MAG: hypothetical protein EA423_13085 [Phycisphaerales bacterium]
MTARRPPGTLCIRDAQRRANAPDEDGVSVPPQVMVDLDRCAGRMVVDEPLGVLCPRVVSSS